MAEDNKKSNIIILYGAVAVGKLTVGKILAEKLSYKLVHNHLTRDLVLSVFERGTFEANVLIEKFRLELYEAAAKHGQNLIITDCYSHSYISPTGLSDPERLRQLDKILADSGADVLFVHLQSRPEEILKRVGGESRKAHQKLLDPIEMKKILESEDFRTSAPVKNNLVIDNSDLSPEETADLIIGHLKT